MSVIDTPERYADDWIDLWLGRWQDVLQPPGSPFVIITDPPYSPRLHSGFRSATDYDTNRRKQIAKRRTVFASDGGRMRGMSIGGLPYAPMSQDFANDAAARFVGAEWFVAFGDHISFRWWEEGLLASGWYVFAPVVWHRTGGSPRFQGDGPASAAEMICVACDEPPCDMMCVARPRRKTACGSLPGWYEFPQMKGNEPGKIIKGQKPLGLMRDIVSDYSRPGDLVVDPCAGGATTLIAAAIEGRRSIGAECDPDTFRKAVNRIKRGYTPVMRLPPRPKAKQEPLL